MKTKIFLLLALPSALWADTADDYVNTIRQIQQDSGVEWDVTVTPNGSVLSPTGVSNDGSFFQLWSIHNTTAVEYLLDEQFVTAYTPNAILEIVTADPYGPVRRTRVDQPFQVRVSVAGLLEPSDPAYATAPDAAKWVEYTHVTFGYPEGKHSLEEIADPVGLLHEEGWMEENYNTTVTFGMTNLTGSDLTSVEGEEVFTISSQEDYGVSATVLDSERLQIWPIATAVISGTDPNVYYEDVPWVTISLKDLYPASTTYLRIYEGSQTSSPSEVEKVSASYVIIEDSIPQNRTLVLKDLDKHFTEEGYHTLEIVHETPFGSEILASSQIRVDRTVEVNGGLYVGE